MVNIITYSSWSLKCLVYLIKNPGVLNFSPVFTAIVGDPLPSGCKVVMMYVWEQWQGLGVQWL